jgi:hypothetical protein
MVNIIHNDADKGAIHMWIKKYKGKPQICVDCGATAKEKKLEWSNVNHKYQRKLEDYTARCCKCHKKFDIEYNNYKLGGIFKKGQHSSPKTEFKKGHKISQETRKKVSEAIKGKTWEEIMGEEKAEKRKKEQSKKYMGKGNPFYNKTNRRNL